MTNHRLTVLVDDNFHYQDEDERYQLGVFDSLAAAISACQRLVDEYLDEVCGKGPSPIGSAADLYQSYTAFGPDPFIVGAAQDVPFSAWTYAKQRCQDIFSGQMPAVRSEPAAD